MWGLAGLAGKEQDGSLGTVPSHLPRPPRSIKTRSQDCAGSQGNSSPVRVGREGPGTSHIHAGL